MRGGMPTECYKRHTQWSTTRKHFKLTDILSAHRDPARLICSVAPECPRVAKCRVRCLCRHSRIQHAAPLEPPLERQSELPVHPKETSFPFVYAPGLQRRHSSSIVSWLQHGRIGVQ
eukprot:scaffold164328_cov32-Tisochrysis_lutea.AAC.3